MSKEGLFRIAGLSFREQTRKQNVERADGGTQRHRAFGAIGSEQACCNDIAEHAARRSLANL